MKRASWVCLLAFGLILSFSMVDARSSDVVPVKGQSTTWDKKISGATRFKLVLDGQAVLDRETGLVWERSPDTTTFTWNSARNQCYNKVVGDRMGWRLPQIVELASLVDNAQSDPALPPGHPFTNVQSDVYWSSTIDWARDAWGADYDTRIVKLYDCYTSYYVWCVRGGCGQVDT